MPVVIRPTPNDRIEPTDQVLLSRRFIPPDDAAHTAPNSILRVFRRHDEELAVIRAYIESEEVKPFRYMRDLRFLRRQREPAFRKERLHLALRLFQRFSR